MLSSSAGAGRSGEAVRQLSHESTADFTGVYRKFSGPLYGTALRLLRRPEDAEDAMQETFLTWYCKSPDVPETKLGAWLHRVLVNECIDRVRRKRRWRTTDVSEELTLAPPPQDGPGLDLERAVARLPEKARLIFLLHDVEGFKHRELTEMLDVTEGTTKSQLFRARKMLREFIDRAPRGAR